MDVPPKYLYEELAKGFEHSPAFGHMHPYDLYRNWLEAMWTFLDMPCNPQKYRECLDRYSFEEGTEFGRLLCVYAKAVEAFPFRDILGELFMRLDIKSVAAGQYFTPFPIAEMMAGMQFSREAFELSVQEKGEVSVCDPAVGSGVMLLAFAKVVDSEFGREGLRYLRLYGADIDMRCVHMCRIQLRMNGLDAFGRMVGLLGSGDSAMPLLAAPEPGSIISPPELCEVATGTTNTVEQEHTVTIDAQTEERQSLPTGQLTLF